MSCSPSKIIIVGNSSNLLEQKNGHLIDKFDYVVRMGGCRINGYEEHVGKKTDLLCVIANDFVVAQGADTGGFFVPKIWVNDFKNVLFLEYDQDIYEEFSFIGNKWGCMSIPVPHAAAGDLFFDRVYKAKQCKNVLQTKKYNDRIFIDAVIHFLREQYNVQGVSWYSKKSRIDMFIDFNGAFSHTKLSVPSKGMYVIDYITTSFKHSQIFITGFDGLRTENYWRQNTELRHQAHSSLKEQYMLKKLLRKGILHEL